MLSPEMVGLAKKLPEKDDVQKAIKAGMLAKNPQEEVKNKVKVVKASPGRRGDAQRRGSRRG